MDLDEAIKHAEEVAKRCEIETDWGMGNHFIDRSGVADVIKCGEEHRQLAKWLMELKEFKSRKGKWIRVDKDKLRCSRCDVIHFIAQYPLGKIDWCPNCGSRNEVENDKGRA